MKPVPRSNVAPTFPPGVILTPASQSFVTASALATRRWHMGMVGAVTFGIIIICVAAALLLVTTVPPQVTRLGVCDGRDCQAYSKLFRNSINTSSDPCLNFYRHVCGKWERYHAESVLMELLLVPFMEQVSSDLKSVKVPQGNQSATEKAAQYYQSCESVLDGNVGTSDLLQVLRSAGLYWPERRTDGDVLSSMMYTSKEIAVTSFLYFEVSKGNTSTVLHVARPDWRDFRNRRRRIADLGKYESYYHDRVAEFRSSASSVTGFKEFFRTEDKILKILPSEAFTNRTESMTFDVFTQNLTPAIQPWRWKKAVTKNFENIDLGTPLFVEVSDVRYVKAVNRLFQELPEPDLLMYAGWVTLHRFPDVFIKLLSDLNYSDTDAARKVQRERCLTIVESQMGWSTVAGTVERRLGQDTRRDLRDIARNILSTMERALHYNMGYNISDNSIFWIRNRYRSTDDLDDVFASYSNMGRYAPGNWIKARRGYTSSYNSATSAMWPQYFKDYFAERLFDFLWAGPPGAPYLDTRKELVIKPHNLAIPMYGNEATSAVKYGAIGSMIARALFASFEGSPGGVDISNITSRNCTWKAGGADDPVQILATDTILKRAASIKLTWDAVGDALKRGDRRLVGLTNYSAAATFFVAHCFLLCNRRDSRHAERACNEPLLMTGIFAEVMGCPLGSPMNPLEPC